MILLITPFELLFGVIKLPFISFGKSFAALSGQPQWNPSDGIEDENDLEPHTEQGF